MIKLILTSTGFTNKAIEAIFLSWVSAPPDRMKVLFIPTAAITTEAKVFVPLCKSDLLQAGVMEANITTYDLDRPLETGEVRSYDAIYVCGGSTAHLTERMAACGFKAALTPFFENGGVYVGVSAGSIAATTGTPFGFCAIDCTLHVHTLTGSHCGTLDTAEHRDVYLTDQQALLILGDDVTIVE